MGLRFPSHQLSNGLYVSGRPEQAKDKPPTMSSTSMPYTGGDIKMSGELGKMFEVHMEHSKRKSGPITSAPSRIGSFARATTHSGNVLPNSTGRSSGPVSASALPGYVSSAAGGTNRQKTNSGTLNKHGDSIKKSSGPQPGGVTPMVRQNSGPIPSMLPTTGLITSGPITSGPLNSTGAPWKVSGSLDSTGSVKLHKFSIVRNQAVSKLTEEDYSFKKSFPKITFWVVILLFIIGFFAGGFILRVVHNAILLILVMVIFCAVAALFIWNICWGRRAIIQYITQYPDTELRTAKNGQYVKVSGVVTCGNVPLDSPYQQIPRCVYTSTSLYEYRGWDSKAANSKHRHFSWGLRAVERLAADFYISDFQSGLRALVKTGYGARVTPYVDESVVVDTNPSNKDLSPHFLGWLAERNLSSDDRVMRLKEGYIKEGSTVSVMGIVQRNDNVLMIVPSSETLSTGCQWTKCILPAAASLEGIVLRCEDTSKVDILPV